jgi:hypothetical protein
LKASYASFADVEIVGFASDSSDSSDSLMVDLESFEPKKLLEKIKLLNI